MTWQNARTYCESNFGHLVTITSAEEQAFLQSNYTGAFWIGATDETVEGQWEWITGETWTYSNWMSGEPNDFNNGEDCGEMSDGQWNDNGSSYMIGFVCEWDFVG